MKTIRILICDDHEIVRNGLVSIFNLDKQFEVAGQTGNSEEILKLVRERKPDVVILDLKMGKSRGDEICGEIKKIDPVCKILILTAYIDETMINRCLVKGASGYVIKDVGSDNLKEQIKAVFRGEQVLDSKVAGIVINRLREYNRTFSDPYNLSAQEKRIISLVIEGMTNRQIADKLTLSENTIKSHLQNIMEKTGVRNRAELTAMAIKNDLV
ncbi:MAG: response regulator transcription factor [Firmicutes bacterium]|nr:response regulator transcription factor [Bacillota bacterium]